MSQDEKIAAMQEMAQFEAWKDEPEVGIFWFLPPHSQFAPDSAEGVLFDMRSLAISLIPKDLRTIPVLHKNIWTKNYYRAKAKGDTGSIYMQDYTLIPRGRVWYDGNNKFRVTVGQWAKEYEPVLTDLLKDEFSLPDFQFDYDEHWDLGHGWSEHDFEIYAK